MCPPAHVAAIRPGQRRVCRGIQPSFCCGQRCSFGPSAGERYLLHTVTFQLSMPWAIESPCAPNEMRQ
jgi:hypothetical protein